MNTNNSKLVLLQPCGLLSHPIISLCQQISINHQPCLSLSQHQPPNLNLASTSCSYFQLQKKKILPHIQPKASLPSSLSSLKIFKLEGRKEQFIRCLMANVFFFTYFQLEFTKFIKTIINVFFLVLEQRSKYFSLMLLFIFRICHPGFCEYFLPQFF